MTHWCMQSNRHSKTKLLVHLHGIRSCTIAITSMSSPQWPPIKLIMQPEWMPMTQQVRLHGHDDECDGTCPMPVITNIQSLKSGSIGSCRHLRKGNIKDGIIMQTKWWVDPSVNTLTPPWQVGMPPKTINVWQYTTPEDTRDDDHMHDHQHRNSWIYFYSMCIAHPYIKKHFSKIHVRRPSKRKSWSQHIQSKLFPQLGSAHVGEQFCKYVYMSICVEMHVCVYVSMCIYIYVHK